jgi:DNA-binding transcriptional MerR regulator
MFTISELVEQTGFPERTIRNYIQQGVLPDADPGTGLYGETHVRLLMAIGLLQEQGVRRHDELRVRLGP